MKNTQRKREEKHFAVTTWTSMTLLILLTLTTFIFSGCGPAIGAYSIYKSVQATTDGSAEMTVGENEIAGQSKLVLANISKLAIWPDNEGEVYLAGNLQESKVFTFIATPYKVGQSIGRNDLDYKINNLTRKEMIETFQSVCKDTKTEALVAFKGVEQETKVNTWSFSRSTMNFRVRLIIYISSDNKIIYDAPATVRIHLGGNPPNMRKVQRNFAQMITRKIIELKQGQTVARK